MGKILNETVYRATMERIEELLPLVDDNTPMDNRYLIELDLLSGLVEEYEMSINQVKLSELLGVSPSRISEFLTGKSEPTLKVAREIGRKLNIDANIVLGV
jgi:HTH-type transcriptional regulator/antitoxin HigA